ncbi:DUF4097 family beta strand repeat-containing protein [Nonomuraea sp. NPDC050786]|uniref:DUF4097 family beta strand repeat-containing protein n=1 Tax=Nonomuraea sp. NPDC050786 TaxID=3154840 RepID=UPI0033F0C501
MRGVWLAAGAVATVIALVISTLVLWRGVARARMPEENTQRSIPFAQKNVRIKTGMGAQVDLSVLPGRAGELVVMKSLVWSRERPAVTDDWDALSSTLRLDAVCPGVDEPEGRDVPLCQADFTVFVPPETDIEAATTSGDLVVNDVFGKLRVSSISGEVHVDNISGAIWARAGTGVIEARGLDVDRADAEIGSGKVSLSFMSAPTEVKAVVRTKGDINLNVPKAAYHVTVDATESDIDVEQNPQASRNIVARAPRGTVSVCCD